MMKIEDHFWVDTIGRNCLRQEPLVDAEVNGGK